MANRAWSEGEIALLSRNDLTIREMAVELGRTRSAVSQKRMRLALEPLPFDSFESRKAHCPQGHPYSSDNLAPNGKSGNRRCLTCKRSRERHRGGCNRCKVGTPHTFKHGTSTGHNYHSCRCIECKTWARESRFKDYWANRERHLRAKRWQRESNLDAHRERERAKRLKPETAATRERRREKLARVPVTRSRKWLPHERSLVLREDLTILELAYMLERSPESVQAQRNWLHNTERIRERNRRWQEANYVRRPRPRRSECHRGHPFDEANTYWDRNGQRYCKTCRKKPPAPPRPPLTHCPQGHEYSDENTRVYGNGYKKCKQCDRDRQLARYYKLKEQAA